MHEDELDADDREAHRRGLRFDVATKPAPRQRWAQQMEAEAGLRQVMQRARAFVGLHHEVGVFVEGGFICWTSCMPDVLDSTVVSMEVS